MGTFEFNGITLSDSRGNLNKTGEVWIHLAYLATLNMFKGNKTFKWRSDSAAARAKCRVSEAADLLSAAENSGVVTRTKIWAGDRPVWHYSDGEFSWDLYVEAVERGLCEPVINERQYEYARALADRRGLFLRPEKEVLAQLAARATPEGRVCTTVGEVTEMVNGTFEATDRETIHKATVARAMNRLEEAGLLVWERKAKGRGKSIIRVPVEGEDGEAP